MNKFLAVITGESYRLPSVIDNEGYWGGGRRVRGENKEFKSIERQYIASKSHMRLIHEIEKKYNLSGEIFINSYKLNEELDKNLLSIYDSKLIETNLYSTQLAKETTLITDTINRLEKLNIQNYRFIIFLRIDFYIRPYFMDYFFLSDDKIIYAHVDSNLDKSCDALKCSQSHHKDYVGNTFPSICHNICYIPKKHYILLLDKIAWFGHESAHRLCDYIDKNDIDLFIKTYHYCSTDHEWNPLYCMVDRQESKNFFNSNYRFDILTGKKTYIENDNVYSKMINQNSVIDELKFL